MATVTDHVLFIRDIIDETHMGALEVLVARFE